MSAKGMILTVLVTQLVEAYCKDELPESEGHDISSGMIGPNVSQWLRDLAEQLTPPSQAEIAASIQRKAEACLQPMYVHEARLNLESVKQCPECFGEGFICQSDGSRRQCTYCKDAK